MRHNSWLPVLALFAALLVLFSALLAPAPSSQQTFHLRLIGIEIAYPAYVKAGSTYAVTGLRFAGLSLGDRPGVWLADLKATGPLGQDNEPLHCSPASVMTITGGTWPLRTWSGDIQGQVTGGTIAFRPDLPILGRCTGPVPATMTISLTGASGRYQFMTTATMSRAIVDHRLVPATIAADVLLQKKLRPLRPPPFWGRFLGHGNMLYVI